MARMNGELVPVQLELDPLSDPISGRMHAGNGETTAFAGWMQLLAALEKARKAGEPDDGGEEAP
jgi:hypothetical protein